MWKIEQRIFANFADPVAHPTAQVWVPSEYTLTGGGAIVQWSGHGSLLTASYPIKRETETDHRGWEARAKDHSVSDPSPLLVFAIGIRLVWKAGSSYTFYTFDQHVLEAESAAAQHPEVSVDSGDVEPVLTGGGARVNWKGHGNLLTASRPISGDGIRYAGWEARAKDHSVASPATITVYAILIKPPPLLDGQILIEQKVATGQSNRSVAHPRASSRLGYRFTLTGGGGIDQWDGHGSLLTASFPLRKPADLSYTGWEVRGKDHGVSDPSIVTSYAIGIRARTP